MYRWPYRDVRDLLEQLVQVERQLADSIRSMHAERRLWLRGQGFLVGLVVGVAMTLLKVLG